MVYGIILRSPPPRFGQELERCVLFFINEPMREE
jgi:hypothetical protein